MLRNVDMQKVEEGPPPVYQIKFTKLTSIGKDLTKCEIGTREHEELNEKVIMMVGETGSGKTTLINAMCNFLYGVKFENNERLRVVSETNTGNKTESQTQCITSYTFNNIQARNFKFLLTIVDTPGFADTKGPKRDEKIVNQIKEFFSNPAGIKHLDAVCFVVNASQCRLTPTQQYILNAMQSLFGKDVAPNIFTMLTFADSMKPQALEALKEAKVNVTKEQSFKFNNCALYADPSLGNDGEDGEDETVFINKSYWKVCMTNLSKFFERLSNVSSVTLKMSNEVLSERETLEKHAEDLVSKISHGVNKLIELKSLLEIHDRDFKSMCKDEVFVVERIKEPIREGKNTTNCFICKTTCHADCTRVDDKDKIYCCVMVDGSCTICPNRCHWPVHHNEPFRYKIIKKKVVNSELRQKYEEKLPVKLSNEQLIKLAEADFRKIQSETIYMIEEIRKTMERLQEIALKPNHWTSTDFIDLLIKAEESERREGWEHRVDQLRQMHKKTEMLVQAVREGRDPFEEYNVYLEQAEALRGEGGAAKAAPSPASARGLYRFDTISHLPQPKFSDDWFKTNS